MDWRNLWTVTAVFLVVIWTAIFSANDNARSTVSVNTTMIHPSSASGFNGGGEITGSLIILTTFEALRCVEKRLKRCGNQ